MGLFYQFPTKDHPLDDRIETCETFVRLKNYGPPLIFWGYLCAILVVLFFMVLAVWSPLEKMIEGEDSINRSIAWAVKAFIFGAPFVLLGFFFFEKEIYKEKNQLKITKKIFGIPFSKKTIQLQSLEIVHHMDSPNVRKLNPKEDMKAFENKGYWILKALDQSSGKMILVDRHNQKHLLRHIKGLLESV